MLRVLRRTEEGARNVEGVRREEGARKVDGGRRERKQGRRQSPRAGGRFRAQGTINTLTLSEVHSQIIAQFLPTSCHQKNEKSNNRVMSAVCI